MNRKKVDETALYDGLKALLETTFPKTCASCGKRYHDLEAFLAGTQQVNGNMSGLKQSFDDEERTIVELFRNCSCGSTVMDLFGDRREPSEKGIKRRQRFKELLDYLTTSGLEYDTTLSELRKVVQGGKSAIIEALIKSR